MQEGSLHSGELPVKTVLVLAICRARWGQTSATRHPRSQAGVSHLKGMEMVTMFMQLTWLIAIGHGI